MRKTALMLYLLFIVTPSAFGQRTTATISGTIMDPSGAVIPGATVVATRTSTGAITSTKSNSSGFYILTNLDVGTYRLQIEQQNFRTYVQEGILLQVDRPVTVNVTLQVGSETQLLTVTGDAPQVDVRTPVLTTVITPEMAQNLPLNGRNVLQLMTLAPDVSPTTPGGYYAYYAQAAIRPESTSVFTSASGGRGNSTGFYLDGGINEDPYDQVANIFPNPDAIQEFSYHTNNYSARFGGRGGGVVNAVTRSGANEFHGTAFEFLRNGDLNARNFFASENDGLKRNQYGVTVGGPIQKNKTFFFGSWQGTKLRSNPTQNVAVTPTAAERAGDFSATPSQLFNPDTGAPFPGNQVPTALISPIAQKILDIVPVGEPGTGLAFYGSRIRNDDNQWTMRVDRNFGNKFHFYGRYLYDQLSAPGQTDKANLLTAAPDNRWRSQNITLSAQYVGRPNLVGTFSATLNRVTLLYTGPDGIPGWTELGVKAPNLITAGPGTTLGLYVGGSIGVFYDSIYRYPRSQYHFDNNWTYVKGGHTIDFGADVKYHERSTGDQDYESEGWIEFTSQRSGNNTLDFLLGRPSYFEQHLPFYFTLQRNVPALYVTDTWKVTRKLTATLGLRWNPWIPLHETSNNKIAIFSQSAYDQGIHSTRFPNAPPGLLFGNDPGVPRTATNPSYKVFAPRIGFAYDPFGDGKTSIRAGFGIYFDEPYGNAWNGQVSGPPFGLSASIPFPNSLEDPYAGHNNPFTPPIDFANLPFPTPASETVFDPTLTRPTIQQWNFTVERQLTGSLMLRATYQGSESYHMYVGVQGNPAVYIPNQSTFENVQDRRPLGQYFTNMTFGKTIGTNSYNALVIQAEKRLSHGLSFMGGFRWAKSLDVASQTDFNVDVANPFDLRSSRGHSDYDISRQFILSYLWEIPTPQSMGFVGRHVIGGWHLNGILTLRAGFPYTVYSGLPYSYSGSSGLERADLIGNPNLPDNRSKGEKLEKWFNPEAFTYNAAGTFGNSPRNFLRGPGFANWDFGAIKSFSIKKGPFKDTQRIDFRAEFFNILNRANFHNPEFNSPQVIDGPNFGRILGAYDPRIIQFGLKYTF